MTLRLYISSRPGQLFLGLGVLILGFVPGLPGCLNPGLIGESEATSYPDTDTSVDVDISDDDVTSTDTDTGADADADANTDVETDAGTDSEDPGGFSGYYRIINKHSGQALDVAGLSTEDGANVHQWPYLGNHNQQWKIEEVTTSYYKIIDARNKEVD